jgi:enterochelin esterase-like enzyme
LSFTGQDVHYVRVGQADASTYVTDDAVTFIVPDPDRDLAGVRLMQDVRIPGDQLAFRHCAGSANWVLVIARPPVRRMEYLLEFRNLDGSTRTGLDPGNPRRVGGAFGPKSVLEFPGYVAPAWLARPGEPGRIADVGVPASAVDATISVRIWAPPDSPDDEPLPLLLAHDGPEYDTLSALTGFLSAGVTGGWLPRLRAALLAPGPRNRWYSANSGYARALTQAVVPALAGRFATKSRIGMGTSLGALAMLHAHCRHPDVFDALFLQSGSFFCPRFDGQERRFPYYRRIVAFVRGVHAGRFPGKPVPVALTCGAIEENIENNRAMTRTLTALSYQASLRELADMHNYTAWRDAFDPELARLLWSVSR